MKPVWSAHIISGKIHSRRRARIFAKIFPVKFNNEIGQYEPQQWGSLFFFKRREIWADLNVLGRMPETRDSVNMLRSRGIRFAENQVIRGRLSLWNVEWYIHFLKNINFLGIHIKTTACVDFWNDSWGVRFAELVCWEATGFITKFIIGVSGFQDQFFSIAGAEVFKFSFEEELLFIQCRRRGMSVLVF